MRVQDAILHCGSELPNIGLEHVAGAAYLDHSLASGRKLGEEAQVVFPSMVSAKRLLRGCGFLKLGLRLR